MSRNHKLLHAMTALALLTATPAFAQEPPFVGAVTSDKVNIRSGAGDNYYPVGAVGTGDLVKVHENLYGWYLIDPPAGSFSYIAKEFVKLGPDGKSGVVTGDRVRVRAPSPAGPDGSYKTQLRMDTGEAVTVVAPEGEYYRIVPPAGVRLFIHSDFVKPASPQQVAAVEKRSATPVAAAKPAEPQAKKQAESAPVPAPAPAEKKPVEPKPTPAEAAKPPAPVEPTKPVGPAKPTVVKSLNVEVQDDGTILVAGEKKDLQGLVAEVKAAVAANPDVTVSVQGGKQTTYEAMTAVISKIKESGVKKVDLATIEPVVEAPPASPENPAEPPATEPEPAPVAAAPADSPEHQLPRLEDLERRYADASKLPLVEQPLAELRVDYENLLAAGELGGRDLALVKARIEILENRREIQAKLMDLAGFQQKLKDSRKERDDAEARKPKVYIAVGRLATSTLYTGEKLPLLYRVLDPLSGLTIAYIQPQDNLKKDIAPLVGEYVGIVGEKEFDPSLKLDVVKTKDLDVLKPKQ